MITIITIMLRSVDAPLPPKATMTDNLEDGLLATSYSM